MRVFVDSTIPTYAAGAPHPHKAPCLRFLSRVQHGEIHAVTSTEVLQEVLYRYHRLSLPDVARTVYSLMVQLCAEVLPVTLADTDACVDLLRTHDGSVRDALHVAVMRTNELDAVATFDVGFEAFGVRGWPPRVGARNQRCRMGICRGLQSTLGSTRPCPPSALTAALPFSRAASAVAMSRPTPQSGAATPGRRQREVAVRALRSTSSACSHRAARRGGPTGPVQRRELA